MLPFASPVLLASRADLGGLPPDWRCQREPDIAWICEAADGIGFRKPAREGHPATRRGSRPRVQEKMRPIQDGLRDIRVSDKRESDAVFPIHARHSQVRSTIGQLMARDLPQQPPAPKQRFKLVVVCYEREPRVIHQGQRVASRTLLRLCVLSPDLQWPTMDFLARPIQEGRRELRHQNFVGATAASQVHNHSSTLFNIIYIMCILSGHDKAPKGRPHCSSRLVWPHP